MKPSTINGKIYSILSLGFLGLLVTGLLLGRNANAKPNSVGCDQTVCWDSALPGEKCCCGGCPGDKMPIDPFGVGVCTCSKIADAGTSAEVNAPTTDGGGGGGGGGFGGLLKSGVGSTSASNEETTTDGFMGYVKGLLTGVITEGTSGGTTSMQLNTGVTATQMAPLPPPYSEKPDGLHLYCAAGPFRYCDLERENSTTLCKGFCKNVCGAENPNWVNYCAICNPSLDIGWLGCIYLNQ